MPGTPTRRRRAMRSTARTLELVARARASSRPCARHRTRAIAGLTRTARGRRARDPGARRRDLRAGDDDDRLNEAIASDTPATNDAERRDVLAGVTMDVLLNEQAAYRARIDAAATRSEAAATELARGPRASSTPSPPSGPPPSASELSRAAGGGRRRGSPTRRRGCSRRSRAWSSRWSRSTRTTAPPARSRRSARPAACEWWGIAGISRVEGRHGTYGGTDAHAERGHRASGSSASSSTAPTPRRWSRTPTTAPSMATRATTAPSARCSSSRRPGSASRPTATRTARRRPSTSTTPALAAATYLCTASSGLDADPGLRTAYFSYNHSVLYVDSVLGYARLYERSIELPEHRAEA